MAENDYKISSENIKQAIMNKNSKKKTVQSVFDTNTWRLETNIFLPPHI